MHRHGLHLRGGVRDLDSYIRGADFSVQLNDYQHEEIDSETDQVNTLFNNRMWVYRGVFDQTKKGVYSGSLGFSGFHRDFETIGAEALAPPTLQNNFAVFALQLGGRVEHNSYDPSGLSERSFTGVSGAAGVRVPLWDGGAFVANYSHSYRAPALEELYNNGPHPGNGVFEIGNSDLSREAGDGIDLSIRHSRGRFTAEYNYFYYHLRDFIFLAPTGEVEETLPVARYEQGTSRYTGFEGAFDIALHESFRLRTGIDYVNAETTHDGTPIPRIPPLRGRIGLEALWKNLRIYPELIMSQDQDRVFPLETRTPGYLTFGIAGSYTIAQQHVAHVISVNAFNLGNTLYRNHLSFIKDFAPEIGRGVRVAYTVRFF